MSPAAAGAGPGGGGLTRAGFLRQLAQEARRLARAVREDGAVTIPAEALGPVPQLRVVAGKPVYLWLEAGEPQARKGLCPRDGSPVYWRGGAFLCPVCGPLGTDDLAPVPVARAGAAVQLFSPE